jgi:NAD(P)-dependent dehydrogenase (short-subunit alcohol dehydrogenase family)
MDLHLKDKVAVITGGSKGIGLGIARAFAREGCHVVITARTAAEVEAAAASIAREFGVSNAGTGSNETIANAPDEKWQSYWDLHLMAAVRLSRALADQMEAKGGGAMLMNASICAVQPLWYEPIYNVTKAALLMFGKCLSVEMIKRNIRVNVVNPGLIRTPDWEKTARELAGDGWEGYLQSVADEHADIRRFGSVEELADFCVFICSPRASYSVGSAYHVDGGMLATV